MEMKVFEEQGKDTNPRVPCTVLVKARATWICQTVNHMIRRFHGPS